MLTDPLIPQGCAPCGQATAWPYAGVSGAITGAGQRG